ncbi:MAG: hypothetical protein AB8G96_15765 [Phycisphaerales bacterium]
MGDPATHFDREPTASEVELAVTWFQAARAMHLAGGRRIEAADASAGLYAQAVLGLPEAACLAAKDPSIIAGRTLVDCLAACERMPDSAGAPFLTGLMMITFGERRLHHLEVRWASMVASAVGVDADAFLECCSAARVMAAMMHSGDAPVSSLPREPEG